MKQTKQKSEVTVGTHPRYPGKEMMPWATDPVYTPRGQIYSGDRCSEPDVFKYFKSATHTHNYLAVITQELRSFGKNLTCCVNFPIETQYADQRM